MQKLNVEYGAAVPSIIPDRECYRVKTPQPTFKPWLKPSEMTGIYSLIACRTLVYPQAVYTLHSLAGRCMHLPGEFWECGVYTGGTAEFVALMMANHPEIASK